MAGVDFDVGRRRHLPLWMLGLATADQVRMSDNGDEKNDNLEGGRPSQAHQSNANTGNTQPEKAVWLHEKETLDVNSTKRKRKSQKDADCNGNFIEAVSEKQKCNGLGRKVRESASRKKRKAKSSKFGSSEELEILSSCDEEGELTMEDLMSIAEEYVKGHKDMEQQQSSNAECESECELPTVASSRNVSGGSLHVNHPTHQLTACNLTASLTSEGIVTNASRTGDPAQDMLDLFLGPLLKKPVEQEKKTGFLTKDMAFAYEFRKQSQNDVREEMVPLMRKKSSLKDKVSMLLD